MTRAEPTTPQRPPTPAARLEGLSPYQPPTPDPNVDLALDANEGAPPAAPHVSLLASIDGEQLRRYPSPARLERALAERFGVTPDRVVVTNGGDDAIDRVCRAVLEPGRTALLHTPTFEMIERSARLAGGTVRSVGWTDGPFPIESFVDAITDDTALAALVSPNNPTGGVVPPAGICEIARAAGRTGTLVMADLAYVEFADKDPTPELLDEPNTVVIRTFSKALGLAGARLGYAIAPPDVARWLRTVGGPYPVSAVSAALGQACLDSTEERSAFIERVRAERAELTGLLRGLGCEPLDSQANFVTARFTDAAAVHRALAARGISVRAFPARPELTDTLRITLPGDPAAFDRLATALRAALDPEETTR